MEQSNADRTPSAVWGAGIAMSWLWGLGLSVSMATTAATGLAGLASLAAIDAGGLWFFGWTMGAPGRDPVAAFAALRTRFLPAFALVQVLAVSITAYVVGALVFAPLLGAIAGWVLAATVCAAALAWARRSAPEAIARGHAAAMGALLLGAALAAGSAWSGAAGGPRVLALPPLGQALTPGFLLGFMVGPWLDVQQWRRATHVHAVGGSVRRAYAWGGLGFALVLCVCALAVGPLVGTSPDFDPAALLRAPGAAARGVAVGGPLGAAGWIAVGAAILFTSIDSAQDAIGWLMRGVVSDVGLPKALPERAATTSAWIFGASAATVAGFALLGLSPLWLVLPFMTTVLGVGMLIWSTAIGRPLRGRPACTAAIGIAGTALMAWGYGSASAPLVALGPIVAALGAFARCDGPGQIAGPGRGRGSRSPRGRDAPAAAARDEAPATAGNVVALMPPSRSKHGHWSGGRFVVEFKTTYDDTNSVGNVYFANYVRFVGKARELMLNDVFPSYDVKTTPFFILTKSFNHEFRKEAREFETIEVRLWLGGGNRRFATIAHELVAADGAVIGRGEQQVMFTDAATRKLIDVPEAFVAGLSGRAAPAAYAVAAE